MFVTLSNFFFCFFCFSFGRDFYMYNLKTAKEDDDDDAAAAAADALPVAREFIEALSVDQSILSNLLVHLSIRYARD